MSLYQGTHYSRTFILTDKATGAVLDISGWTFQAMFRDALDDATEIVELTTANTGFTSTAPATGALVMDITAVQSALFPLGKVVFDVLRTDPTDGPVWLFGGRLPVKKAVTR